MNLHSGKHYDARLKSLLLYLPFEGPCEGQGGGGGDGDGGGDDVDDLGNVDDLGDVRDYVGDVGEHHVQFWISLIACCQRRKVNERLDHHQVRPHLQSDQSRCGA